MSGKLVKCRFCEFRMRPSRLQGHIEKRHPDDAERVEAEQYRAMLDAESKECALRRIEAGESQSRCEATEFDREAAHLHATSSPPRPRASGS